MCVKQCAGIAKTGLQCKITVKNGDFCHHHLGQANGILPQRHSPKKQTPNVSPSKSIPKTPTRVVVTLAQPKSNLGLPSKSTQRSPRKPPKSKDEIARKAGFIYIYTLASLLNKGGGEFFKTRNLEPSSNGKWVNYSPQKLEYMFVKVGMTTKTVEVRLQQWEKMCNHKLVCLHPGCEGQEQSLVAKLKRLSLSRRHDKYDYRTFQMSDKGFYAARNVWLAEQEIHALLKKRYGGGPVYCQGCIEQAKEEKKGHRILQFFRRKEDLPGKEYKVHVEWFPIPKTEIREVFKIVDSVCMRYTA